MDLIKEFMDDILTDWAYRVHDGMPNPKNSEHLKELHLVLRDYDVPNNIIIEIITNIINEQDDDEEKVTFKHDGETRTITKKTARQYASYYNLFVMSCISP